MSLLNLSNVPNNMISGLNDEMVEWVSEQSTERYLTEITSVFMENLNEEESTYYEVPDEVGQELNRIEKESIPTSTMKQTENYVNIFRRFLEEETFRLISKTYLTEFQTTTYAFFIQDSKRNDGTMYSPGTLVCIRAAIHRHLTSADVNKKINILKDDDQISC